jgi:hypothetical protein
LRMVGEEDLKHVKFLEVEAFGKYVLVCNTMMNCAYLIGESGWNFGCIGVPLSTTGKLMNSRGTNRWRVFLVYDSMADNYILELHTVRLVRGSFFYFSHFFKNPAPTPPSFLIKYGRRGRLAFRDRSFHNKL